MNFGYQNNRLTSAYGGTMPSGSFDLEGNQLKDTDVASKTYKYSSDGKMASSHYDHVESGNNYVDDETLGYSGDNLLTKIATSHQPDGVSAETDATYQIRSTVLGGEVVAETGSSGARTRTFIRANGTVVATTDYNRAATWMHKDLSLDSLRSTRPDGTVIGGNGEDTDRHELDPTGKSLGFYDPYAGGIPDSIPDLFQAQQSFSSVVNGLPTTFAVDGLQVPRSYFEEATEFAFGSIFGLLEAQARAAPNRAPGKAGDGVLQRSHEFVLASGGDRLVHVGVAQGLTAITVTEFDGLGRNGFECFVWIGHGG